MKTTTRCRNPVSGFSSKRFEVFELCKGFMLCSNPQVAIFKKARILNFVLTAEFVYKAYKFQSVSWTIRKLGFCILSLSSQWQRKIENLILFNLRKTNEKIYNRKKKKTQKKNRKKTAKKSHLSLIKFCVQKCTQICFYL